MKKFATVIASVSLLTSLVFTPNIVFASEDEIFNIHTKGHLNSINIEREYDEKTGLDIVQEKHGMDLKGKFDVTEESFSANLLNLEDDSSYDLEGTIEQVLSEGNAYYYKGIANGNDLTKFEAVVEKVSNNDYNATINIFEYKSENDKDPFARTFMFDGKGSTSNTYTEQAERNPIIMSLSKQPENARLASDNDEEYYQYIEGGLGKGYGYRVQGPKITYVDAGNNYSFRWKTDVDDIEKMLKEDGLNYTGAHDISQFRLRIYTRDPLVFNTVTPISDSEEEFEVPMYFGKTIGVAPIPVVVKSVEITGSGTDDLLYDFNWSSATWPSSAYLDERSWNTDPGNKPGFAVRYTMDTPPTIDPGKVKINFNGYFKYRSKVNKYSLLINHFTEITEKDFYSIEIVE